MINILIAAIIIILIGYHFVVNAVAIVRMLIDGARFVARTLRGTAQDPSRQAQETAARERAKRDHQDQDEVKERLRRDEQAKTEQERRWAEERLKAESRRKAEEEKSRQQEYERRNRSSSAPHTIRSDEHHYGQILGLQGQVAYSDVKKMYRDLASQYHPDKVSHLGPKLKAVAEQEMKLINEAFEYFRNKYEIK